MWVRLKESPRDGPLMGTSDDLDTSRTEVKTYVPAYQKEIWQDHADRLGMTQSEFVKTMVQAGRRGFDFDTDRAAPTENGDSATSGGSNADMADRIVTILDDNGPLDWDELVEELTYDVEDRLEAAIEELQDKNRIRYSGRDGGYKLNA